MQKRAENRCLSTVSWSRYWNAERNLHNEQTNKHTTSLVTRDCTPLQYYPPKRRGQLCPLNCTARGLVVGVENNTRFMRPLDSMIWSTESYLLGILIPIPSLVEGVNPCIRASLWFNTLLYCSALQCSCYESHVLACLTNTFGKCCFCRITELLLVWRHLYTLFFYFLTFTPLPENGCRIIFLQC